MGWRPGLPYGSELRERVLRLVDEGRPVPEVAVLLRVSVSYIYTALARRRDHGETEARQGRGVRPQKLAAHLTALADQLCEVPDATLEELRAWLIETRDVTVSTGCLWNTLDRMQLTHKKSPSARRSRTVPMSPPRGRSGIRRSRT